MRGRARPARRCCRAWALNGNVNTLYGQAGGASASMRPISAPAWAPAMNWISGARTATRWNPRRPLARASAADRATVALTVTAGDRQHLFPASVAARAAGRGARQSEIVAGYSERGAAAGEGGLCRANADLIQAARQPGGAAGAIAGAGAAGTGSPQRAGHPAGPAAGRLRRSTGDSLDGIGAARRGAGPAVGTCWRAGPTSWRRKPIWRRPMPIWRRRAPPILPDITLTANGGVAKPGAERRRSTPWAAPAWRPALGAGAGADHFRRRQDRGQDRGDRSARGRIAGGLSRRRHRRLRRCRECAGQSCPSGAPRKRRCATR